jgi:hypothetical protein
MVLVTLISACAQKPVEEPKVDVKWVEQVSREHNHEILKCYESALKKDDKLQGDLAIELDTKASGAVEAVRIKHSVSPELDACAQRQAQGWTYPWIKTPTTAIQENYHLSFGGDGQPRVAFSGPGMDREQIRSTVKSHLPEVRSCYERALKYKPALAGKLVLEWEVLGSGTVNNIVVREPLDPTVDKCVVDRLAKWKFPQPPNNIVAKVVYPFIFSDK